MVSFGLAIALLASTAAQAAIYKVAFIPNGNQTHTDLQAAINTAVANPGDDEIRIIQGSADNITGWSINMSNGDGLTIGGGWNADFTVQDNDASLTTLGGPLLNNRVLRIVVNDGDLLLGGVTITGGNNVASGAGIQVLMTGGIGGGGPMPSVSLLNVIVRDNVASSALSAGGGGIEVIAENNAAFNLVSSIVSQNTVTSTGATVAGGGADVLLLNGAAAFIALNNISENVGTAPASDNAQGVGLSLSANSSDALLSGNFISGNIANGNLSSGIGLNLGGSGTANIVAEAQQVVASVDNAAVAGQQVTLFSFDNSIIAFRSSWVAAGGTGGVRANANGNSTINLSNLTVYNNPQTGIQMSGAGTLNLANSISYLNGTDLSAGGASQFTNLIGVNPQLLSPNTPNISPTSPAVDAGSIVLLECGPGTFDVFLQPRFNGPAIDIGAYETQIEIFADGFEDLPVLLKRLARLRPLGALVNC